MKITIDDVLKRENKSRYWLAKEIGVTYQTLFNICNNQTTSMKFEIIEKICNALSCEPNDIFNINK